MPRSSSATALKDPEAMHAPATDEASASDSQPQNLQENDLVRGIVPPEIDVSKIEDMLAQFASERAPVILRQDMVREQATERAREIEADLDSVRSRRALLDRLYASVCEGLDAEREDLEAALAILQHGFVGASTSK